LTTLILASLASARPHGRAAPDAGTLSRLTARGAWSRLRRHRKTIAVDSYSPLCHSSFVKDRNRPADRRQATSGPSEVICTRSAFCRPPFSILDF
jgi:hypothetical protein